MKNLSEKVILITGAAQGLGEATCKTLSNEGAIVVGADIKEKQLKSLVATLTQNGKKADGIVMDVADEQSIKNGVTEVIKKYGRIDALINNAGLDVDPKPVEEYTLSDFDTVINVNVRGPFLLTKYILPDMYTRNSGYIINIGSTSSLHTWPNASLYHMSKVALRGLSWSLFTEIKEKKSNVKVSTILPGGMKTAHVVERFPDMDLSWLQDPTSVAETIKFVLLQPEKSVISELTVIPPLEWSLP